MSKKIKKKRQEKLLEIEHRRPDLYQRARWLYDQSLILLSSAEWECKRVDERLEKIDKDNVGEIRLEYEERSQLYNELETMTKRMILIRKELEKINNEYEELKIKIDKELRKK